MPEGAQSPATEDNKQLGKQSIGQDDKAGAKTGAEQRPEVAGKSAEGKKDESGSGGNVSKEAIATADASAKALESENGSSRKEVETGKKD